MYKIVKDGITLGYAASPTYVKLLDNGDFGLTDEAHATGIAYGSDVYALEGRGGLGDQETVALIEVDAGAVLNEQAAVIAALSEELSNTQVALCEAYEAMMGGAA